VNLYLRGIEEAGELPRATQKVRRRLKSIRKAASKLRKFFTENPQADAASEYFERSAGNPFYRAIGLDLNPYFAKMSELLRKKSVWIDGRDVLFHCPIDRDGLCERLDQLCAFIDRQKRGQSGKPASDTWNSLMLQLADIYEAATGKEATVTENEHRAKAGRRYSGPFVDIATLIDRTTADYCKTNAHPNSALGPALRRLLKRRKIGRSKTR
jgi:hypothetical protein